MRSLKDKTGYKQQQLADKTGINAGTLSRYFAGIDDDSANFETVRKLVMCMGGSLDELAGMEAGADRDLDAYQLVVAGLEARLDEKDERISARWRLAEKERERAGEEIAYERRRARAAIIISYVALGLFALLFLLDFLLPSMGWIRR